MLKTINITKPLMIGVEDLFLNNNDQRRLDHPKVGGVILFKRNFKDKKQITALCDHIHQINPEIIIGIDQEGGRVQRLDNEEFSQLRNLYDIAKDYANNKEETILLVQNHAQIMSSELKTIGIDLCFAPVIDLYHQKSQIIFKRSFSDNPEVVIALSDIYVNEMKKNGIIPVLKHFPGHGSVILDTHKETVIDHRNLNDLEKTDLKPFIYHAKNLNAIMASHMLLPKIDKKIVSFSNEWLQTILREKYGFKGIIFSDDLGMNAALNEVSNKKDCVIECLNAGCDIAILGNDFDVIDHVLMDL